MKGGAAPYHLFSREHYTPAGLYFLLELWPLEVPVRYRATLGARGLARFSSQTSSAPQGGTARPPRGVCRCRCTVVARRWNF
jgi:hypothetical protein